MSSGSCVGVWGCGWVDVLAYGVLGGWVGGCVSGWVNRCVGCVCLFVLCWCVCSVVCLVIGMFICLLACLCLFVCFLSGTKLFNISILHNTENIYIGIIFFNHVYLYSYLLCWNHMIQGLSSNRQNKCEDKRLWEHAWSSGKAQDSQSLDHQCCEFEPRYGQYVVIPGQDS